MAATSRRRTCRTTRRRAEFEAYIDHSTSRTAPSTGLVYWQLNKGWPTLLRDLYNHDFGKAGSYFGAKKANEPLHVLYACDTGAVDWAKTMGNPQATMTQFGDLGQLQDLSPASVCTSARTPTPRQDPTEQTLSPA